MRLTLLAAALLLAAPAALRAQPVTVVVVRHAEKADASADPVLSEAGTARAEALAAALKDAGVQAVIVSPRQRTRLTAQGVLQARGLTPEVVGLTPTHVADVARAVRARKGQVVLVVGHSNTVPAIVTALGGPKLADLCDAQYSQLFTLVVPEQGAPTVVRSQYGAPDAPEAGSCATGMKP